MYKIEFRSTPDFVEKVYVGLYEKEAGYDQGLFPFHLTQTKNCITNEVEYSVKFVANKPHFIDEVTEKIIDKAKRDLKEAVLTSFYLEPEGNILAVFLSTEKRGMLSCYSMIDGHSQCSRQYLKSLKLAEDKMELERVLNVLEETYGYKIANNNSMEKVLIETEIEELNEEILDLEEQERKLLMTMEDIHQINDLKNHSPEDRFAKMEVPKMQGIEFLRMQLIYCRKRLKELKALLG